MLGDDFEQLWLDLFELRGYLDVAARHALDDQMLTDEDAAVIAQLTTLAERASALATSRLTDAERIGLADLSATISACEGRASSYLLAVAPP